MRRVVRHCLQLVRPHLSWYVASCGVVSQRLQRTAPYVSEYVPGGQFVQRSMVGSWLGSWTSCRDDLFL